MSEVNDPVIGCENVPTDGPSLHQLLAEYMEIGRLEGIATERARVIAIIEGSASRINREILLTLLRDGV